MSLARELHQRLMNPPNAVHDDGIDLKRVHKKYTPPIVENIPLVVETPTQVIHQKSEVELEIEQLQARIDDLLTIATMRTASKISVRAIQIAVCQRYDVRLLDVLSPRKTAPVVMARQIAIYLAKTLTLRSLKTIGRAFGRDHSTVLHTVRKITWLRQLDQNLDDDLRALERAFTA